MSFLTKKCIPFSQTGYFSKTILDYLEKNENLLSFYRFFPDLKGFKEEILQFSNGVDRSGLVNALKKQYSDLPIEIQHVAVQKNIDRLLDADTFTITTGHQLNIFSGPLYVFSKLLTAICLSEVLKKLHPDKNFVPVYWMASEDHDIDEIDHFTLFGKVYKFETTYKGASGKLSLNNFQELSNSIIEKFGDSPHAEFLASLIRTAYSEDRNLASATRYWVNALLGKYGVVVLDPDDADLKRKFSSVMADDALNQTAFNLVSKTNLELTEKHYSPQVHPREINLFYLSEKERSRIIFENDHYKVLDSEIIFTKNELILKLKENPERFSPNVVLRPLYQECILPNLAYIGGPAEIGYWLEYKKLFEHYKIHFPGLVLRNSMLILDSGTLERMEKLHIKVEKIFLSENELIKQYITEFSEEEFNIQKIGVEFENLFDQLNQKINAIDPTLQPATESERHRFLNALRQLEQKVIRSQKKKNETEVNQIKKIKEKLFPSGQLQERTETILPYLLRYGFEFIDLLKEQIDPFTLEFNLLLESGIIKKSTSATLNEGKLHE